MDLDFFVPGRPATQGSKTAFAVRRGGNYTGQVVLTEANKHNRPWRADVKAWGAKAMDGETPITAPVHLDIQFFLARPKSHYRKSGALKPNAPAVVAKMPDLSKLIRAVEDALTGIVWRDDAQIASIRGSKCYADAPGAYIRVQQLTK